MNISYHCKTLIEALQLVDQVGKIPASRLRRVFAGL